MHKVLNEVYLQYFLHGWAVNRETNLMMLINLKLADGYCSFTVANHELSRLIKFVSRFTVHPCKKYYK